MSTQARIHHFKEDSQTGLVQNFPHTAVWTSRYTFASFARVASSTLNVVVGCSSVQDQLKTASQLKGSIP